MPAASRLKALEIPETIRSVCLSYRVQEGILQIELLTWTLSIEYLYEIWDVLTQLVVERSGQTCDVLSILRSEQFACCFHCPDHVRYVFECSKNPLPVLDLVFGGLRHGVSDLSVS